MQQLAKVAECDQQRPLRSNRAAHKVRTSPLVDIKYDNHLIPKDD